MGNSVLHMTMFLFIRYDLVWDFKDQVIPESSREQNELKTGAGI